MTKTTRIEMPRPDKHWLMQLDQRRYEDPAGALGELQASAHQVPKKLSALFLGVCGSTYRILAGRSQRIEHRLRQAEDHIAFGRWIANRLRTPKAKADLDLRLSYVVADRGHYAKALAIAESANATSEREKDLPGRGKALADQGRYLYYLKRHQEATNAYTAALQLLPENETRYRFSSFHNLGFCYLSTGQPRIALKYSTLAEGLVPSRWFEAKLRWLQARICTALSDFDGAESYLSRTVEIFRQLHYGEAALASCELVRVQLLQSRPVDAWRTAAEIRPLVIRMSKNEVVAAAVVELLRGGQEALTLDLVEKVLSQVEKARERSEWRSLTKKWA